MRLGDYVSFNIKDSKIIGIITYLDLEDDYIEITKDVPTIADNKIIKKTDWYGITINEKSENEYVGKMDDSDEFEINILKQNLEGNFFSYKYLDDENESIIKEIKPNTNYHSIILDGQKNTDPGDLIEIISIDYDREIISYINLDKDTEETYEINVSKGISKRSESDFYDLCEIDYSDSDSDSDEEELIEETEFYVHETIPEHEKELTEYEKKEFMTKTLLEMHNLKDNDIIILVDRLLDCLNNKYNSKSIWYKNLNSFKSKDIIPILKNYTIHNTYSDVYESDVPYYSFIQKIISPLLIKDENNEKNIEIKNSIEGKDALMSNIILNPSYKYKNNFDIENTSDNIEIDKYYIKNTGNCYFKNIPPSVSEFAEISQELKKKNNSLNIFDIFNISENDIEIEYLNEKNFIYDKKVKNIKKSNLIKIKESDKYNLLKDHKKSNKKVGKKDYKKSEKYDIKDKSKYDDILEEFFWGNKKYIWPKNLELKKLLDINKNEKLATYIINSYITGNSIESINNNKEEFEKSYFENINKPLKIEKSKSKEKIYLKNTKKTIQDSIELHSDFESDSQTIKIWDYANNILNIQEGVNLKKKILTSGEYVRYARKNENPYYYYDINTNNKFIPIYELSKLEIKLTLYNTKAKELYDTLLLEWGISDENTNTIISKVNSEILGYKDDDYTFLENRSVEHIATIKDELNNDKDDDKFKDELIRNGFIEGFNQLLKLFQNKSQYSYGLGVNLYEHKKCSSDFFLSNEWLLFKSYYDFDKIDNKEKIIKLSIKLSKIDKKTKINIKLKDEDKNVNFIQLLNNIKKTSKVSVLKIYHDGLKRLLTKCKDNYIKNLKVTIGRYIVTYLYSNLNISNSAKLKIFKEYSDELKKETKKPIWAEDLNIFNEKKIKSFSHKLWNYNNKEDTSYDYSYKQKIGNFNYKNSDIKSKIIVSKDIEGFTVKELIKKENMTELSYHQQKIEKEKFIESKYELDKKKWKNFYSSVIIKDPSNEWYIIDEKNSEFIETEYKSLLMNFKKILLSNNIKVNFQFPNILKELKKKGFQERIQSWLNEIYDIKEHISEIDDYNTIIDIILVDANNYIDYICYNKNTKLSWKKLWIILIQHLIGINLDKSNIEFSNYIQSLERIISYYISKNKIISGETIIMNKSKVEDIYATVTEDEASKHYDKNNSSKIEQMISKIEKEKSLGDYSLGTKKQFDISTVQSAIVDNETQFEYTDSSNDYTTYDSSWSQNFDNDVVGDDE